MRWTDAPCRHRHAARCDRPSTSKDACPSAVSSRARGLARLIERERRESETAEAQGAMEARRHG
jgi:hypothetical protein